MCLDTLLNVFLAIAVDNLATAQELTAEQEKQKDSQMKAAASAAAAQMVVPTFTDGDGDSLPLSLYDLSGMEAPQVNICPPTPGPRHISTPAQM